MLDPTVADVMVQIHQIFAKYGLRLNMSPGKTEAILSYKGTGARDCRRARFIDDHGRLPVPGHLDLHVVACYAHLGTVASQSMSIATELKTRVGKASSAFRQMRRTIFHNRHIPVKARLQLLESLVISILMYGSGAWPLLSHRQYTHVSHAILSWQRSIVGVGFWSHTRMTDYEFLATWELPCLSVRLAKHRLLLALKMYQHAPIELWNCISLEDDLCEDSWLHALRHALRWYARLCPHDVPAETDWSTVDIFKWLSAATPACANRVRIAVKKHILQEHMIQEVAHGYRDLQEVCTQHGICFDNAPVPDNLLLQRFQCSTCPASFTTPQGLSAHRWRVHHEISLERQYVFSSTCAACGKCFWTAQRLQQHLRYSRKHEDGCLAILRRHFDPQATSTPIALPDFHRNMHRLPWVYADGPASVPATTCWVRKHQHDWEQWRARWAEHGYPDELPDIICQTVFDRIRAITLQVCRDYAHDAIADQLIFQWCSFIDECERRSEIQGVYALWAFLIWGRSDITDVLECVDDVDIGPIIEQAYADLAQEFPMDPLLSELDRLHRGRPPVEIPLEVPASVRDPRNHHALESLDGCFDNPDELLSPFVDSDVLRWPRPRGVPVCRFPDGSHTIVMIHLFSGRRREGDCHFWAQTLFSEFFPDLKLCVLSLDTAVDPNLCNLAEGEGLAALFRIVDAQYVACSLAGPPCETWSAARHVPAPDDSPFQWPRPLRSALRPWGVHGLNLRELRQLALGSKLMLHNVRLELRVYLGGGATGMEHPAPPFDMTFASVWRTKLQSKFCMQAPGSQQIVFHQWRFGAPCFKPTTLRLLGLPPSSNVFHAEEIPGLQKPCNILEGFDHTEKRFRTAETKEYPAGLCKAMIITLFTGLRTRIRQEGSRIHSFNDLRPEDGQWMLRVAEASGTVFASDFLPDYQPNRGT